MTFDSILFDLDGTLWNATYSTTAFFADRLQELHYHVKIEQPLVQSVMGLTVEEIAEVYFKDFPKADRLPMMMAANTGKTDYLKKHGGILYPYLEDTLNILSKQYQLHIVSNCAEGYIQAFLAAHNLAAYFTDYEYSGRTGKPKSENIRLLVQRNHLQAPVYVGDIEKDQQASKAAHVPFILAAYGFGSASEYIGKLDQLKDLPALLQQLKQEK